MTVIITFFGWILAIVYLVLLAFMIHRYDEAEKYITKPPTIRTHGFILSFVLIASNLYIGNIFLPVLLSVFTFLFYVAHAALWELKNGK